MGLLHDTCKCGWPLKLLYGRGKNHPVKSYFGLVTTPGFYPSPNMYRSIDRYIYIYIYINVYIYLYIHIIYIYIYMCVCLWYIYPELPGHA